MKLVLAHLLVLMTVNLQTTAQEMIPVHVLSWNIYMLPHAISYTGQFRRATAIGELLRSENYDIILLQEAFGKTSRKKLREALQGAYPYEIEPRNRNRLVNSGLWVLSRHEITHADFIFFEGGIVSDRHAAKGAVLIELEIGGQTYQFVNTHLQAEDGKEFAKVRTDQFKMIADLLEKHEKPKVPQFILGDMNTRKKMTREYEQMLAQLCVTDGTVKVVDGSELSVAGAATWGCSNNDLIGSKYKGQTCQLDYALQRNTGYPFKVRRELKTYTKQWSRKRKHLSDHYAIALTILP